MNEQTRQAITELLLKMADDALIIGHRNSEWTGLGPMLEEDIAFSSMAQDKLGHAVGLYTILHEHFGLPDADTLALKRKAEEMKCCQLTELPIGGYEFSLMRHFLFDHAEMLRYEALQQSSFEPLAQFSAKVRGEIKYHILHADTWVGRLCNGSQEAKARLQAALNEAFPYAPGIFEPGSFEQTLVESGVFEGEAALRHHWLAAVGGKLAQCGLELPNTEGRQAGFGGRNGIHTPHLSDLLSEMTEVLMLDEDAEW